MKKDKIRGCLQTIKNNYALTQAGIMFLADPEAGKKFEEYYSAIAEHPEAQFGYIKYIFKDYSLLKHATNELRKSVLRNCLKEIFETLMSELVSGNQKEILIKAPWYQFLRIVRNSLSHDFHLQFRKSDKKELPVTWSDLTISIDMDGKYLPMAGFLSRAKAQQLIDEIIDYIEKKF